MLVKDKLLAQARNDDEKIIIGRAIDIIERVKKSGAPSVTHFLSPNDIMLYEMVMNSLGDVKYESFGGVEATERKKLAISPIDCDWYDPIYEITAINVKLKEPKEVSHRDYLGAILGLGIKRDVVGDIIVEEDQANIMVDTKIADFIMNNLQKIGSVNIETAIIDSAEVEKPETQYQTLALTLASLRLDSVMSKAFQLSRSAAANFIKQGKVEVNHRAQNSPAATVTEGDVISCRGRGRCVVLKDLGKTKKGKIKIEIGFPMV